METLAKPLCRRWMHPALLALLLVMIFCDGAAGITNTIYWKDVHQRIDGFGASSAWYSSLTTAQADMFFTTNSGTGVSSIGSNFTYTGIALSLLRSRISPDSSTNGTSETSIMKQAQDRGARVWSTPWTPPASMKSNGSNAGGTLKTQSYQDYAAYLAKYVLKMKNSYGVNLYALSVQNEPDMSVSYDSCVWSAQQIHDFVPYLYNALVSNGVSSTKILLPEYSTWNFSIASTTMNDTNTAAMVGIMACHAYGGTIAAPNTYGKELWETETADLSGADNSINNGLSWAKKIHDFMTVAEANAWHYWWLRAMYNSGTGNDGSGLCGTNQVPTIRAYVLGQFSRFVRPGYYRIGVTNSGSLYVSAYKDLSSTNAFAVVAINDTGSSVTRTFRLDHFTATSVTPWITSSTQSLTQLSPATVTNAVFSYSVPAMSMVTFEGLGTPTNATPVANAQSVTTGEGFAQPVTLTANDGDGDALTYTIVAAPAHGTLSGTAPNLTYTPDVNYGGIDSFSFKVNDGTADSLVATVSVNVAAIGMPVVDNAGGATNQTVTTATLQGLLAAGTMANAWVCWGEQDRGTGSTSAWDHVQAVGVVNQGVVFTVPVTGLATNQSNFYRCWVANADGEAWSAAAAYFSGTPVGSGGWTPADIGPCAWYDAADGSTLTASGGSVSQWSDKSGNTNHLTQGTPNLRPTLSAAAINGLNALDFTGNIMGTAVNPFGTNVQDALVLVVHKVDSIQVGVLFSLTGSGANANRWQSHAPYSDGNVYFDCGGSGGSNRLSGSFGVTAGTVVMSGFYGSVSNNVQQIYKNGSLLFGDTSGHSVPTAGGMSIGGQGSTYQDTTIGEVIVLNGVVSSVDRQKLEGYLSWKWGLRGNLPSGHPYKNVAPERSSGAIVNLAPGGISSSQATLKGSLVATSTNYDVYVHWGTVDGGTNAAAWGSSAYVGSWSHVSTNVSFVASGLASGQTNYYAFSVSNAGVNVWATPSWQFMTPGTNLGALCTLTVSSSYGTPSPAGVTSPASNGVVTALMLNSPVTSGTTQYVCAGWIGAGSLASGSGMSTSFTITNDTTITWQWKTNYWVNCGVSGAGVLDKASVWYVLGTNLVVNATPDVNSVFDAWLGDTNGASIAGTQIMFAVNAPKNITARFLPIVWNIAAAAGANGSISPSGVVAVGQGTSQLFTITSDANYHVADVLVDSLSVGAVTGYTFTNVRASHTIAASFAINPYTVIFNLGTNGTRSGGGALTQMLAYASAAVAPSVTPNSGYTFIGWDASFGSITSNMTVNAQYSGNRAPVVSAGTNQTVLLAGDWSPASVAPLAWYDAADAATIVQSGGTVSQWNDKSGHGRHVAQAITTNQPAYSGGAVSFDGTNDYLWSSSPFMWANGQADVYIVAAVNAGTDARMVAEAYSSSTMQMYCLAQTHKSDATRMDSFLRNDANAAIFNHGYLSPVAAFDNTVKIYQWSDTATNLSGRVNGGTETAISYSRSGTMTLNTFAIGAIYRSGAGSAWAKASIREIVIAGKLSDADRMALEGYLAQKWGMATNLPAGHPYKDSAPGMVTVTLDGTVSDADGDPLTTTWSVISGPASVALANSNAVDTTAMFTTAGSYVLRLTANDGFTQTSSDITITVVTNLASQYTFTVVSAYGTPSPSGVTTSAWNTVMHPALLDSPVINSTTQYVCTGWIGAGSLTNGSGTNTSFTITNNTIITWQWQTNCWIDFSVIGN